MEHNLEYSNPEDLIYFERRIEWVKEASTEDEKTKRTYTVLVEILERMQSIKKKEGNGLQPGD